VNRKRPLQEILMAKYMANLGPWMGGRRGAGDPFPSSLWQSTTQRPAYQLHTIRCVAQLMAAPVMGQGAKPPKCCLAPTVKHTGQESGG